jgi:hypothetical protein
MAKPKLEIYQISSDKNTYIINRYLDDKNNNYEYQIYKLVQGKAVAREFGIKDFISGRKSKLNAREMCDKLIEKIKSNNK